jgi:uncharacterized protein YbaA (DUF1428 family)
MVYVEGFILAVPAANKELYRKHAVEAVSYFKGLGATRLVECWGDDVPDGKVTDFKRAVKAKPDEVVLFSWVEYPSKQVRDAANEKMQADPNANAMAASMPFDGQRMVYGGFSVLVEEGGTGKPGYVDGTLLPVPAGNRDAFRAWAAKAAAALKEHGAVRVVDAWGDDVPDGKVTDLKGAVQATGDEKIAYCWIEWPSKEVRDKSWKKLMADPRMHPDKDRVLFDGKRMIYGGFAPIVDQ